MKKQKTWRAQLVFREKEREHLEIFESVKEVGRRSVNIYMEEGSERNISSAKLASPFQTVMMKKTALHALPLARGVRPRPSTINAGNMSDVLLKK